jgi:4-hydroxybenzoate polyprenyltransferase
MPPVNQPLPDIREEKRFERLLPPGLIPYARLMRLDRPIGTWLLLLPCWWGVAMASRGFLDLWLMFLFGVGAIVMRGAGCVINDIYDRAIDRKVARTQTRPLASGALKLWQAFLFLGFLLLLGLCVLPFFNPLTIKLAFGAMPIVALYPLAKRFIWAPQFVLGLAFNWGALLGVSAVRGNVGWTSFALYAGGIFWTLAYDTIYAHQDKEDDAKIGVKSLALWLGDKSKLAVGGFFLAALCFFALAGWGEGLGRLFFWGLLIAFCHGVWQVATWKPDEPSNCLRRFQSNRDFGLIVLVSLVLGGL